MPRPKSLTTGWAWANNGWHWVEYGKTLCGQKMYYRPDISAADQWHSEELDCKRCATRLRDVHPRNKALRADGGMGES